MTHPSVRFATAALLVGGLATAGCARSSATAPVPAPARSTAVVRYDLPPAPTASCAAAPAPRPVVVAAAPAPAPAPAPFVERGERAAPATSLPSQVPTQISSAPPVRLINVTCPVMLGNPVDPGVTSLWNGRLVAFSDVAARARFDENPARFASNLPGYASGTSSDAFAPSAARVAGPVAPQPASLARRGAAGPIGPPAAFVGSPDGDEDEAPAECGGDEECPGGNCRLPR